MDGREREVSGGWKRERGEWWMEEREVSGGWQRERGEWWMEERER